jgi:hypothetical protein
MWWKYQSIIHNHTEVLEDELYSVSLGQNWAIPKLLNWLETNLICVRRSTSQLISDKTGHRIKTSAFTWIYTSWRSLVQLSHQHVITAAWFSVVVEDQQPRTVWRTGPLWEPLHEGCQSVYRCVHWFCMNMMCMYDSLHTWMSEFTTTISLKVHQIEYTISCKIQNL